MITRLGIGILSLILSSSNLLAGPFGFNFTDTPSSYESCTKSKKSNFRWLCQKAPNSSSEFGMYVLIATPQTGICEIGAIQIYDHKPMKLAELHTKLDHIAYLLTSKYGQPFVTPADFTEDATLSGFKRDYVRFLQRRSNYAFAWLFDKEEEHKIASIDLATITGSPGEQAIKISYFGDNISRCREIALKELAMPF